MCRPATVVLQSLEGPGRLNLSRLEIQGEEDDMGLMVMMLMNDDDQNDVG